MPTTAGNFLDCERHALGCCRRREGECSRTEHGQSPTSVGASNAVHTRAVAVTCFDDPPRSERTYTRGAGATSPSARSHGRARWPSSLATVGAGAHGARYRSRENRRLGLPRYAQSRRDGCLRTPCRSAWLWDALVPGDTGSQQLRTGGVAARGHATDDRSLRHRQHLPARGVRRRNRATHSGRAVEGAISARPRVVAQAHGRGGPDARLREPGRDNACLPGRDGARHVRLARAAWGRGIPRPDHR